MCDNMFDRPRQFIQFLRDTLRTLLGPKGGARSLYDSGMAVLRIYPEEMEMPTAQEPGLVRPKDLWLYLGYGNLRTFQFAFLLLRCVDVLQAGKALSVKLCHDGSDEEKTKPIKMPEVGLVAVRRQLMDHASAKVFCEVFMLDDSHMMPVPVFRPRFVRVRRPSEAIIKSLVPELWTYLRTSGGGKDPLFDNTEKGDDQSSGDDSDNDSDGGDHLLRRLHQKAKEARISFSS